MKCSLVVAGFQQYYAAYIISSHSICDGSHICVHYISSDGAALWCRRRLLQDFLSASTCLQDQTNPHLEHLVTLNDFPVGDVPYKTLFVFVFCFCFIYFFLGGGRLYKRKDNNNNNNKTLAEIISAQSIQHLCNL